MPATKPFARDLLLELLEAVSGRAMSLAEIANACEARSANVPAAIEALETEGLVSVAVGRGRAVYNATAAGRAALEARGGTPAGASHTVAILFTDMVGSTALIDSLGELAAHRVCRRHFAILREAIAAHSGHEIKSLGDGLMVVFDEPRAALACAQAMQRGIARDGEELEVRIGIDVGTPLRDSGDYFGTPVIVAKRLCDAAGGGEILVSDRLRALIGDGDPDEFESCGALALKGMDQPVAASAVPV